MTFCNWNVAGVPTPETVAFTVKDPTVALPVAVTLDIPDASVVVVIVAPLEVPLDSVADAPEAGAA